MMKEQTNSLLIFLPEYRVPLTPMVLEVAISISPPAIFDKQSNVATLLWSPKPNEIRIQRTANEVQSE